MRVLVTGANGFLGRYLLKELKSQGHHALAFVRSQQSAESLKGFDCEVITGSLESLEDIKKGLQNIKAIIHAAGGGKAENPDSFFKNNVLPTQCLLKGIEHSKVEKFILVSSLAAIGPSPANAPRQNHSPANPLSPYGESKAQAEAAVLPIKKNIQIGIVRPPTIYGPADYRLFPLFKAAQKGWAPIPGGLPKTLSLIHVQDCAAAIIRCLDANYESGSTFFIDDGQIHSIENLVETLGQAFNTHPKIIPIPVPLLSIFALLSTLTTKLLKRDAWLTPSKVKELKEPHWICDSSASQKILEWRPQIKLAQGIQSTAQWYLEHGWLKK